VRTILFFYNNHIDLRTYRISISVYVVARSAVPVSDGTHNRSSGLSGWIGFCIANKPDISQIHDTVLILFKVNYTSLIVALASARKYSCSLIASSSRATSRSSTGGMEGNTLHVDTAKPTDRKVNALDFACSMVLFGWLLASIHCYSWHLKQSRLREETLIYIHMNNKSYKSSCNQLIETWTLYVYIN